MLVSVAKIKKRVSLNALSFCQCANMSALYYLPQELWLKLKEEVSILGPNYLLQHPRQHLHQRLHQHLHHRHHLRHLLLLRRSPLEELRPRLVLLEVVVRSLENLQLKYLVFIISLSLLSLSFFLSLSVFLCNCMVLDV